MRTDTQKHLLAYTDAILGGGGVKVEQPLENERADYLPDWQIVLHITISQTTTLKKITPFALCCLFFLSFFSEIYSIKIRLWRQHVLIKSTINAMHMNKKKSHIRVCCYQISTKHKLYMSDGKLYDSTVLYLHV